MGCGDSSLSRQPGDLPPQPHFVFRGSPGEVTKPPSPRLLVPYVESHGIREAEGFAQGHSVGSGGEEAELSLLTPSPGIFPARYLPPACGPALTTCTSLPTHYSHQ